MPSETTEQRDRGPRLRRLIVSLTVAAVLAFIVLTAVDVLLVAFGAILYAVFLHGVARVIADRTPLPYRGALALILVAAPAAAVGLAVALGPEIAAQLDELTVALPKAWQQLEEQMRGYGWVAWLLDQAPGAIEDNQNGILGRISGVFSTAASLAVNAAVVVVAGIYFAIAPRQYVGPLLRLLPLAARPDGERWLEATGLALRRWLVGRIASMIVVGVLTSAGLWLLGVPLALVLGVLAGALSFVPNIGPLAAIVPAVLVAWVQSSRLALLVVALYVAIQLLESYVITPLIEERAVSLPPAFLILAQLLIGVLFGLVGLIIATPLVVVAVVTVQFLYVQRVLGDEVALLGTTDETSA